MDFPKIQIANTTLPIHTIFCVGRNYADHAHELNNPLPTEPMIFTKPLNCIIYTDQFIELPQSSNEVHHEVEVLLALGAGGRNIPPEKALSLVSGYGIGLDITARDIQQRAKQKSAPWTVSKGFDTFAPISAFTPSADVPDPTNLDFRLHVNDEPRQQANTNQMLFSCAQIIAYLSGIFTLAPGDLIFTGSPSGVARIQPGDRLRAELGDGLAELNVGVRGPAGGDREGL